MDAALTVRKPKVRHLRHKPVFSDLLDEDVFELQIRMYYSIFMDVSYPSTNFDHHPAAHERQRRM